MITIHRATEVDAKTKKRIACLHIRDARGGAVTFARLKKKDIADWAGGLVEGTVIRTTWVHHGDQILIMIRRYSQVEIRYAYWHDTGIPKGLENEEILDRYASLPESIFHAFETREDIYKLRLMVARYNITVDTLKRFMQRKDAIRKNFWLDEDEEGPVFDGPKADIETEIYNKLAVYKDLAAVAQTIPECVIFNRVADIRTRWVLAAQVVAANGNPERFYSDAALWKFNGHGVTDGERDKRRAGQTCGFNVRLLAQWHAASLTWAQEGNRWEPIYQIYKLAELANHARKHPDCPSPPGHCHWMALRRVRKEIMKEWRRECRFADQGSNVTQEGNAGKGVGTIRTQPAHQDCFDGSAPKVSADAAS